MKFHVGLFLIALIVPTLHAKGLLLSEITHLKNQLRDTMDLKTGKLKERKLSIISMRHTNGGLKKASRSSPRVDRYLKPTKPRYLSDVATPVNGLRNSTVSKSESTKKSANSVEINKSLLDSRKLPNNNTKNTILSNSKAISQIRKQVATNIIKNKSEIIKKTLSRNALRGNKASSVKSTPQKKNNPKKAKKAKKATKKHAATKGKKGKKVVHRKNQTKSHNTTIKHQIVAKKSANAKKLVRNNVKQKGKVAKKVHHGKKTRHLKVGLNDSDTKLLENLSKKVQALKSNPTNDNKQANSELSASKLSQTKVKDSGKAERSLLDLPSQNEFYSSIVDEYSSKI
jgi:hypothetical protein